jgi:hypothetical protein
MRSRYLPCASLLHSFWWEESGVAFRAVAEADPGCLMVYWSQGMTLRNSPLAGSPRRVRPTRRYWPRNSTRQRGAPGGAKRASR